MPVLISCQSLTKSFSTRPLFSDISLSVDEKDRVGLIGPNGAGKSTLLKILAGLVDPDEGTVTARKFLKIAYVAQDSLFEPGLSLRQVVANELSSTDLDDAQKKTRIETVLSKVGFPDPDGEVSTLSGGWRKRLALAAQLAKEPDLLLLDEPTNHLDLEAVLWLEDLLKSAPFAYALVSHDRSFLQNVSSRIIELNAVYKDGYLSVKGPYSDFLEAREEYMVSQKHEEQALASKVRREIAWLQRGARARQTKAQGRIRDAEKLMQNFEDVRGRNQQNRSVEIDFSATGRKTKELLVCKGIAKSFGEKNLFSELDIVLHPGDKLGLLGTNGSGKTTLLRILANELQADKGSVKRADGLRIVWFDQNREQLNQNISLKEALSPTGDSVIYRDRSLHVATWAKRFLFRTDQLNMPVSYLSGGEQARILIANLMLQAADILILDEPTNDLDIPSLEVLEESLEEFPGAIVLVTHDRFMLDTISHRLLALDGSGGNKYFADYEQWEKVGKNQEFKAPEQNGKASRNSIAPVQTAGKEKNEEVESAAPEKKALSTSEKKELASIDQKIEEAEKAVGKIKTEMEKPEYASNHVKLNDKLKELHDAEDAVAKLYARWEDLESRK